MIIASFFFLHICTFQAWFFRFWSVKMDMSVTQCFNLLCPIRLRCIWFLFIMHWLPTCVWCIVKIQIQAFRKHPPFLKRLLLPLIDCFFYDILIIFMEVLCRTWRSLVLVSFAEVTLLLSAEKNNNSIYIYTPHCYEKRPHILKHFTFTALADTHKMSKHNDVWMSLFWNIDQK